MKRCPECRRDYYDDSLLYCLDDGNALLEGPANVSEPVTAILSGITPGGSTPSGEEPTRHQISIADRTAILDAGAGTDPLVKRTGLRANPAALGVIAALITIGIAAGGFFIGTRFLSGPDTSPAPTEPVKMTRLTSSGKVTRAVISPDGKFLSYVESEGERQSLWTKQIATNSNVKVIEPTPTDYFDVTFSPDGNYIYFLAKSANEKSASLQRVPTLGGTAVRVFNDVTEAISFSPVGTEIAFQRYDVRTTESSLMIASADGVRERKIASLSEHEWFSTRGAAWSPDGKFIACGAGDDRNERQMTMVVINVSDQTLKELTGKRWDSIGRSVWLSDGSGIIFSASDNGTNAPRQIWHVSYPDGAARRVTHDLNSYVDVSITADATAFVATQTDLTSNIWISQTADIARVQRIEGSRDDGAGGIAWTPDGRIVYVSSASGSTEIWIMNQQGSERRQLTNDGAIKFSPTVSRDGRHVVFVSELTGAKLWRIELDGSHLTQLTNGNYDSGPRISPDSQWVVYSSYNSGKLNLWKVPLAGGEPVQLNDLNSTEPDVSPDGKLVAAFHNDSNFVAKLLVLPLDGTTSARMFELPQNLCWDCGARWTLDSLAVTFVEKRGTGTILREQPIDGGPARQLVEFKDDGMLHREWSPNKKQVAIVRGTSRTDVVLIRNFR